ncbi:zinc-ribbon domain-containing protein [Paucibacter sp. M5-1]|uniref:zinc-ribbon domain-containing protein n=1 Tax=Paucibacter sp. M5-1 TaxID=3015998 RepID=UPI0022B8E644|nr:zinc-ribbon domain-containing protein [Paucibacter sp. M5-1]MCZ7883786.1 hypothetical protein [Paucibacter sp. M5-1]
MALGKCRECGKEVSSEAKACPHCGVAKPIRKKVGVLGWMAVALVGFAVFRIATPSGGAIEATQAKAPPAVVAPPPAPKLTKEEACTIGIADVIKEAKDDLAANRPNYAVNVLEACEKLTKDPAAISLLKEARAAVVKAVQRDKQIAAAERARKKKEGVSIGMSEQDVRDSSWGRPESINRTTSASGTREQWVYGGRNYLYFENGRLTSIQN